MAHVSGWAQASAAVAALNGTIDVPFAMPTNGTAQQVDTSAHKVSLNGWPLARTDTTVAVLQTGGAYFLRVTNKTATAWPIRSVVAAECDFMVDFNDPPEALTPTDWMELLLIQQAQLIGLEGRVAALENP